MAACLTRCCWRSSPTPAWGRRSLREIAAWAGGPAVSSRKERGDLVDDVGLLFRQKLGKNGQRQSLARGAFGFREIALAITKIAKTFLQMQRQWVIDFRADTVRLQVCAQGVAARDANDE